MNTKIGLNHQPTHQPPESSRPLLGIKEAEIWYGDFTDQYKINQGGMVGRTLGHDHLKKSQI